MSPKNEYHSTPVHHLVQLSYAVHLLDGRTVLVLSEETCLAQFIADNGAQVVQVTDREPTPSAKSGGGQIDCHRLPLKTLNFEDNIFGAAVIPNLAGILNPKETLAEVKRILNPDAHLLVATPNPEIKNSPKKSTGEAIDYYKLYDWLVSIFPVVQMVGQSPFDGYAVADLGYDDEDLEIGFNTDLLGEEGNTIEWFFAVCGNSSAAIDPYSIIQIPSDTSNVSILKSALAEAKLELSNRGVRIESLEKKLEEELMQSEEARARAVKIAKELDNERKATTKRQLEEEFSRRSQDIDQQSLVQKTQKELRLAIDRANSAEAARDEIIERMRADAQELDRLRKKLDLLEEKRRSAPPPGPSQEMQKRMKLAEERARSAEAARDEIIERMRADAHELEKLRSRFADLEKRYTEVTSVAREPDPKLVKNLRLAEERARSAEAARDDLIDQMRADAAELEALRRKLDDLEEKQAHPGPETPTPETAARIKEIEERATAAEAAKNEVVEQMQRERATNEKLQQALEARKEEAEQIATRERALLDEIAALKKAAADATTPESPVTTAAAEEEENARKEAETMLKEEIATLEKEIAELEARLRIVAKEKTDGVTENARLESLVRDLVVKLERFEETVSGQESVSPQASSAESNDASSEAHDRINALEEELAALWGAKAGEHRARVEAELELTSMMQEAESTKMTLTELSIELQSRGKELKRSIAQQESLTRALEAEELKQAELAAALKSAQSAPHLQDQQMKVAELEGELQSVKWRVDELTARNKTLEDELDKGLQTEDELRAVIEEVQQAQSRSVTASGETTYARQRTLERCISSINALFETNNGLAQRLNHQGEELVEQHRVLQAQGSALEASKRRERLLDEEIESQRNRANRLKSDMDQVTQRMAELETELRSAQSQRERMQKETERISSALEETKRTRREAIAKMESARQEAEDARSKLEATSIEMKGAHDQISDLKTVIENGESTAAQSLAETLSTLDAERAISKQTQEKLLLTEDQLADELSRAEGLMAAVTVLKAELENESKLMRLAGADAARTSGEVEALRAKIEKNEHRIQEQGLEIETDLQVLSDLRRQVVILNKKLTQKDKIDKSAVEEIRNALEAKEKEIQPLTEELNKKQSDLARLNAQDETSRQRLAEAEKELETLQEQLSDMQTKVVTINQSKVDMSAELAEAIERSERLDAQLRTQQESEKASMKALRTEIEALESKLGSALAEVSKAQSEFNEIDSKHRSALKEAEGIVSEKETLLVSLTEQLEDREQRSAMLEQENRILNAQIKEHEVDVSAWNMELKIRSARISQLEREIEALRRA
jgi:chromosome segregation ATPase